MYDLAELTQILEDLEEKDEALATQLLKELGAITKKHHGLIKNRDQNLSHEEWKRLCDQSQKEVEQVVSKIMAFRRAH